jgi:hypothetical protein
MKAAKEAYTKEYDRDTAEAADFGSYKVEGNTVVFEVYNAGYRTYDKVVATVGADGKATGARVEYMGLARYPPRHCHVKGHVPGKRGLFFYTDMTHKGESCD